MGNVYTWSVPRAVLNDAYRQVTDGPQLGRFTLTRHESGTRTRLPWSPTSRRVRLFPSPKGAAQFAVTVAAEFVRVRLARFGPHDCQNDQTWRHEG